MAHARDLATAQHEAAHVVVGVALGLRLVDVRVTPDDPHWHGEATFREHHWARSGARRTALALMCAAGVAWERAVDPHRGRYTAASDRAELRKLTRSRHDVESCVRAAGAMLATLGPAHARVTRALLERDLSGADVAALARGERLTPDE